MASGGVVGGGGVDAARPGPSRVAAAKEETGEWYTGVPVLDMSTMLGPQGETYDEEYKKLRGLVERNHDLLGPALPVVFVDVVRDLYIHAREIESNPRLTPYNKCAFLFQTFDAVVLAYKSLSLVYCDNSGARSVYGYSDLALKNLLARVEAISRKIANSVHDAYSLTVLNDVVATAQQRLSQVRTEQDMLEFVRAVSGVSADNGSTGNLPQGVERYKDSVPEAAKLMRRLYATNPNKYYVRDFHDTMFLIATSNAPATLSTALETRLAGKDRNIVCFHVGGDRTFATSMCASAIAYLRETLSGGTTGARGGINDMTGEDIETYRINYGRIFSKYRGESEKNFDLLMEWIKKKVRASDRFRIFWFPDIENLMSPRTANDPEHIVTIKNSMLQHMDAFNKDQTLRSFLLLFHSSEGPLDDAFSRRLQTVIKTPENPLSESDIAAEVMGAEMARYHINLTDGLVTQLAERAARIVDEQSSRIGGFAHVQAKLRELYVNQKLTLRYDARAIKTNDVSPETLNEIVGRYLAIGSHDTFYDLNESPVRPDDVNMIAFSPSSSLAARFDGSRVTPFKYNANIRGDPKDIEGRTTARIIFLHDV